MNSRASIALSVCGLLPVFAVAPVYAEEIPIFREMMRSSDYEALTEWGHRYEKGKGVAKNPDRAIRLYCRAARIGFPEAQYRLGVLYAKGKGTKSDDKLAAAWFYLAAKSKNADALAKVDELGIRREPKRYASCMLSDGTYADSRFQPHPARGRVAKMVRKLAPKYRLDANLVLAVIEAESNFNPRALSPKNAQGLMQLIPATARRFGVRNVWNAEQNIRGGMSYLRWLTDHFKGNVEHVLAAYNAGEGAVHQYGGIPPYQETRSYVKRILRRLGR